ncbi:MAG: hypothetical protein MZV65_53215 [Chromatiales bacterium]|nr:hypothetical protein [Chromatiales bacterium]
MAEALKSLLAPEFDLVGVVEDGRALVEAAANAAAGRHRRRRHDAPPERHRRAGAAEAGRRPHARGVPHDAPGRAASRGARWRPGPRASCSSTRRRPSWSRPSAPRSTAGPT